MTILQGFSAISIQEYYSIAPAQVLPCGDNNEICWTSDKNANARDQPASFTYHPPRHFLALVAGYRLHSALACQIRRCSWMATTNITFVPSLSENISLAMCLEPIEVGKHDGEYVHWELYHPLLGKWSELPDGYKLNSPDDGVICYPNGKPFSGEINVYTGELLEGEQDAYDCETTMVIANSMERLPIPVGFRAPRWYDGLEYDTKDHKPCFDKGDKDDANKPHCDEDKEHGTNKSYSEEDDQYHMPNRKEWHRQHKNDSPSPDTEQEDEKLNEDFSSPESAKNAPPLQRFNKKATKVYHIAYSSLPKEEKIAFLEHMEQELIIIKGDPTRAEILSASRRGAIQLSALILDIYVLRQANVFHRNFNITVVSALIPEASDPVLAQAASFFYGDPVVVCLFGGQAGMLKDVFGKMCKDQPRVRASSSTQHLLNGCESGSKDQGGASGSTQPRCRFDDNDGDNKESNTDKKVIKGGKTVFTTAGAMLRKAAKRQTEARRRRVLPNCKETHSTLAGFWWPLLSQ
ncbi:hypothetical protein FPV67DRAFT_1451981 [Lyophyllum atratum]|nr:hypothetical protein FPV67DRAFT_1451981 [Lyophyllum atratum]